MNPHLIVGTDQMTPKPDVDVNPGQVHREPVYWVDGVRHREGAISIQALMRNCGNLYLDVKGEGQEQNSRP
jgi:hypothetical protein